MNINNNSENKVDLKPRLGFLESSSDTEGEFFSPVPSRPTIPEYRMTTELLKKDKFIELIKGPTDIINLYRDSIKVKPLGSGTTSEGEIIKLSKEKDATMYILKRTNFNEEPSRAKKIFKKIKDRLINEQLIYSILEKDPDYKKYISSLLYADVPLALHHTPDYNYAYFIFEYRDGMTLDEFIDTLLKNNQLVSFEDVMMLVGKINDALNFIHRNGVIHRDLKPENIFIDTSKGNIPLLIDFDISCRIGIDCDIAEFIGTEKYATNGAKKKRTNVLSFDSYTYSENSDRYALVRIMEEDLIKIVKPEDVIKLRRQIELLKPLKLLGGNRMRRNKTRKVRGGECRIGILNPWWGGNKTIRKRGGGCGCGAVKPQMMQLPSGISLGPLTAELKGGACPCQAVPKLPVPMGGYIPTAKNLKYLKKWKRGESIGFTMRSSLKAKGLIPRSNGTKRLSPKYR
jgi:tRNA A-37 threonylcarbamoyl transferase component Bud32